MSLVAIVLVGGAGSAIAAWGMSRGGREARWAAILGCLALLVVLVLALAMDAPQITDASAASTDGWFRGHVLPTGYLRLTIALWALDSVLVIGIAWLLGGTEALRGLLPATLAAIAGGLVALGATDLSIGITVAAGIGLLSLAVVGTADRTASVAVAARELRVVVGGAAMLLGAVAVAPVAAALVLAASASPGAGDVAGSAGPPASEANAVLGLVAVAIVAGVAARFGAIPFHFRVPRLTDTIPPIAMPLVLAWLPLPLGIVGLAALDVLVGPLPLSLAGEQSLIVAIALVTMGAGAFAAFVAEDVRHSIGYLVVADAGLALLGFAALDPAAWGPTRIWLLTAAASKTAVAAWGAVMESRFETRSLPELRGWVRHAPILAAGLALAVVATYGLPGWIVLSSRLDLASLVADRQWAIPLGIAGFLTLPVYVRYFVVGLGARSSHVAQAAPERVRRRSATDPAGNAAGPDVPWLDERLLEEDGSTHPGELGRASAGAVRSLVRAVMRDRTELISAGVLALAVLATLTAWGALDLGAASNEPAPIVSGPSAD